MTNDTHENDVEERREGPDEAIRLSADALAAAERLEAGEPTYHGRPLRLYLEGKGCDGFYYGVAFDEAREGDRHFRQGRIDLVCDEDTYIFVKGSVIDWVDDERGRGFLVDNPAHRRYRGKFYKRKSWQEKLEAKKSPKGGVTSSSQ